MKEIKLNNFEKEIENNAEQFVRVSTKTRQRIEKWK